MPSFRPVLIFVLMTLLAGCTTVSKEPVSELRPTSDSGQWFFLAPEDRTAGAHHTRHAEIFGKYVDGYNAYILQGIDAAQNTAMDGGGYFIGIKAVPTESPVGYPLTLFGRPLLDPPRTTSYCSGSSYAAFIEGMNRIFPDGAARLSPERAEALRMQEPDGGRREDGVKFWGHWNADGFGNHFALAQYSGMGTVIRPERARPGDFLNISWTNGGGHSVVFLGWAKGENGERQLMYWASQKGTNGYGDQIVSLDRVKNVKIVRLTHPENVFTFDVARPVDLKVPGDTVDWK